MAAPVYGGHTNIHWKGVGHEIFDVKFFSWIRFPAPDFPIRAILHFFILCTEIFESHLSLMLLTTVNSFSYRFKMALIRYSGAQVKLIYEKKHEFKIHFRLPLMVLHISSGHQMISNCLPLIRHFKVFGICVFESRRGHYYNMENLDQSSLPTLIKNPETEMSWLGIEPRPPAYRVRTLPKSYLDRLLRNYDPLLCRWFRFAQLAKGKKSRP